MPSATKPRPLAVRFYVCELELHCGGTRPRPLTGAYTDRHDAQAALEALSDDYPNAFVLPFRGVLHARSLTFAEASPDI